MAEAQGLPPDHAGRDPLQVVWTRNGPLAVTRAFELSLEGNRVIRRHGQRRPVETRDVLASEWKDVCDAVYQLDWGLAVALFETLGRGIDGADQSMLKDLRQRLEGILLRMKLTAKKAGVPLQAAGENQAGPANRRMGAGAPAAVQATVPAAPRAAAQMVRGWKGILTAVGETYSKEAAKALKRMNEKENGPIRKVGRGKPPRVDKARLLAWWDGLTERVDVQDQERKNARATLSESYEHGTESVTVLPGIAGHAKRRAK